MFWPIFIGILSGYGFVGLVFAALVCVWGRWNYPKKEFREIILMAGGVLWLWPVFLAIELWDMW
jgi:hypothetical protein